MQAFISIHRKAERRPEQKRPSRRRRRRRRRRRASLITVTASSFLTQYCAGGKIEKNEKGCACGAYRGGERGTQGVGGET
jgi:hypothetical protein